MEPINRDWTNDRGRRDGGISTGIGYTIAWQRGALITEGRNGAFLLEVLHSCLIQLNYYQESIFASKENAIAREHLTIAIEALESRSNRRKAEGTLGTHIPDKSRD